MKKNMKDTKSLVESKGKELKMKDTKKKVTKKIWIVAARQVETFRIQVEAKNEAAAIKKAMDMDMDEWSEDGDCSFGTCEVGDGIVLYPWIDGLIDEDEFGQRDEEEE